MAKAKDTTYKLPKDIQSALKKDFKRPSRDPADRVLSLVRTKNVMEIVEGG